MMITKKEAMENVKAWKEQKEVERKERVQKYLDEVVGVAITRQSKAGIGMARFPMMDIEADNNLLVEMIIENYEFKKEDIQKVITTSEYRIEWQ